MKISTIILLIFGGILIIPAYSGAIVTDPAPDNISSCYANWEYRDYGNYGLLANIGGSQQRTGPDIMLECSIETGGLLDAIENVIKVEAQNLKAKKRFYLHYDPYSWLGTHYDWWGIMVQPSDWMFEGRWKFTLTYNGSDGSKHRQVWVEPPIDKAFPAHICHVTVNRSATKFVVSWSGIGIPGDSIHPIDYRVRIFEAGTTNFVEDIRGNWEGGGTLVTGTYDESFNRVTFRIPAKYGGKAYVCRLEHKAHWQRALYYLVLPKFCQ